MNQAKIGKFLQELRKEKGLTQEQLAERFFVARRTVSRWETGSNMPDLDVLVQLSEFYDVGLRELLDGERKGAEMDKETQDTIRKVAEYSNAQQERTTKMMRWFFVAGVVVLILKLVLEMTDYDGVPSPEFLMGVADGMAMGIMILGLMYTTGVLTKFQAFKRRMLGLDA